MVLRTVTTTREAVAALQQDGATFLAGGTLVVRALNGGDTSVKTLVRVLESGAQTAIQVHGDEVRISAAATMSDVADHADVTWLAAAARSVGTPTIQNMATVGGNLYARSPHGDFTVALLAVEASVSLTGSDGSHTVGLEEFLGRRDSAYARSLVTDVTFKALRNPADFRFRKMTRVRPGGLSVISIAAVIEEDEQGVISRARVAYGAMAPTPIRNRAVEAALIGNRRTAEGIADALACAHEGTSPANDALASAWYRRAVSAVQLKRLLLEARQ